MKKKYLDKRAAAKYLGISWRTLEGWRAEGKGPPWLKLGSGITSSIRYLQSDLDNWLKKMRGGDT